MKTIYFSLCLITLVSFCACSRLTSSNTSRSTAEATPQKRIASADVVRADIQPVKISPGKSAETSVRLNIQSGYHVNANPPTYSYLKATELNIPAKEGISVSSIKYPDPAVRKFAFADEPLKVYEGKADLKVSLKAEPSAAKGERHLSGKLSIQACDEEVCYPPGTIDVSVLVQVN